MFSVRCLNPLWYAALLWLWCAAAAAQDQALPGDASAVPAWQPDFHSVGNRTDIPEGVVSALAQDRSGLIWIGTPQGLVRFDGLEFRRFVHSRSDPQSLVGNYVRALLLAHDGRLWVGTESTGVAVLEPGSERFTSLAPGAATSADTADSHGASGRTVVALAEDSDGSIVIGSVGGGVQRLAANGQQFEAIATNASAGSPALNIGSLRFGRDGTLWIGTADGLWRLRKGQHAIEAARDGGDILMAGHFVSSLLETDDGHLWAGTSKGDILMLDGATGESRWLDTRTYGQVNSAISAFLQLTPDRIWVARRNGIEIRDAADGRLLQRLQHSPLLPAGLAGPDVRALLLDQAGHVWVGGWGSGVQRADPQYRGIQVVGRRIEGNAGLVEPTLRCVLHRADGRIWLCQSGHGIAEIGADLAWHGSLPAEPWSSEVLGTTWISALLEDVDGAVWVGMDGNGLYRLDTQKRVLERYGLQHGLPERGVRRLGRAADGAVFLGTTDGVYRLARGADQGEEIKTPAGSRLGDEFNAFAADAQGGMWIGGASGLFYRAHDQTTAIRVRGRAGHEPSAQSILGLLIDASQRLWMDTPDGLYALSDFDGEFAAFDSISARFGRAGDAFGGNLLEDAAGRIWTHRFVYDPHAGSMYELSQADGVDIGVGWFRSYDKSADGRLLFGGSKGLLVVDPALFRGWAYAPPLVVTELKRGGVAAPYDGTSTIVVEPDQRSFSIEFAALDYTVPERNRYRYRLHGYDDDWITTDAGNRVASYGNLWPGDYSLEVHGSNRNGDFSPHQLNIRVTVLPLFWQTPWFFALAVLALGLMVYAGFRWRTRVLRARATVLRALVEQRTLELRSSHEHLAASKGDLESAHSQLTATHERLLDTQQQMVLQEKMAALGTLTAGVAHEINNPTNFADGAVQQIEIGLDQLHEFLRHLAGEEAPAEVLQAIAERFTHLGEMTATAREGHERIKRIVRDLRQFTRLDEAELKAVPIAEPIQSTVNLVRTRFDRIRFDLDLKFNPTIECQPAKLGQVFMNLFVNACEAIGECKDGRAGVVRIGTHADGGQVAIDIADNGMGMDDATLQHVFEPFFTTKPVGAGTGLGLSIVFGIVKDHGGSIEVSSKVGEGTRFRVTLPLARQSLPPPKG